MKSTQRREAGLGLALISAAAFGTSGVFGTSLIDAGWSPGAAVISRMGIAALVLTVPALLALRGRWAQLRRSAGKVVIYGLFAIAGAQLFYFNALAHLSVGVALLLEYLGILMVVGWVWLRSGQPPRRLTTIGGLLSLVGLALVLDVFGSVQVSLVGVLWGLGAAVGLAVYFVVSAHDEDPLPPIAMAWTGMCVGVLALGAAGVLGLMPLRARSVDVTLIDAQVSWLVPVLGLSIVAAAFAYTTGIGAARILGATVASFVGLAEVLFAITFAWLLLDQLPAPVQLVGGAVIVLGVALVRVDDLRSMPRLVPDDAAPGEGHSGGQSSPQALAV